LSTIKEHISSKLNSALLKLNIEDKSIIIERPKEESFGDLSSNVAMLIAKKMKKSPKETAQLIINELELPDKFISKAEVAGPGFINFFIADDYYKSELNNILQLNADFGKSNKHKGQTANIEWVSANPTGPLHLGHGRHIALGKAVANLIECSGYKLTREYYYNIAGKQMDNLAKSVYARYMQIFQPDYPFPEDGYVGDYVIEIAQILKEEYGNKLIHSEDLNIFKTSGDHWCFK